MSILIVDDSADTRRLLAAMLTRHGHEVVLASSAHEAFRCLQLDDPHAISPMELILMDIIMPEMNGIGACQRIKATDRFRDVPVIMVTTKQEPQTVAAALAAGASDYIRKPVKRVELLARVNSALVIKQESDARKARQQMLLQQNLELEAAVAEITRLQGFLVLCTYCKRLRTDKGRWAEIEVYLHEHSQAFLSPTLCGECGGAPS